VTDNVPALIDLRFVQAVADELHTFLIQKFELGTPNATERCAKYLVEDSSVVERREGLIAQKKRLDSVAAELLKFGLRV
jgi:hypothetical protein